MEALRALAIFAEPPGAHTARLAGLLGLATAPTPAAFTDLFVCQQTPYASAYLSADGMVGGEARDRIAGFWRALGLEPPREPDHLATMLGAYAALADRAEADGEPRHRDAWRRARHAFLWEHLLSWLPGYLLAVRRHAGEPFAGWARLLLDAVLEEARALGGPATLPLHLRDAPGLADPRHDAAHAFLVSVLTPARSGVILTRADLARAARALGLGLRAGDRTLAIRSLIEQDAPATLAWLAAEARAWQGQYTALAATIGPLAVAWADRARATADLIDALGREAREDPSA